MHKGDYAKMKTKEEILKMSKEELQEYKWCDELNIEKENIKCTDCSNCLYCRNLIGKRDSYYICNVEVTKREFDEKLKEIKNEE